MNTPLPPFVIEEIRRRRESRAPIWNAGIAIGVFVAVGATSAWMTTAPVMSPRAVATAFIEAQFDHDWAEAWDLLCRPARADFRGYEDYAATRSYAEPVHWDVDVSTRSGHRLGTAGPAAVVVDVTATSDTYYDFEIEKAVVVVVEDGAFRACGYQESEG
jgi:hypothetical protein